MLLLYEPRDNKCDMHGSVSVGIAARVKSIRNRITNESWSLMLIMRVIEGIGM